VAHRGAKLTPIGRRLVDRVLVLGWSASEAAKAVGVSPATWLSGRGTAGGAC
jgi:hypothetical protein